MPIMVKGARTPVPFLAGAFLALSIALSASGCAHPRPDAQNAKADELSDEAFQAYLAKVSLITVDEAYRAMLILADGECKAKTFAERKETLESRGISRAAWNLQPENVIDCGSVAFMVCRICQIRGGIDMHIFGSWGLGDRRYAMRELIYRELIEDAVDYTYMTGARLVGLLAKADEIMAKKNLYPNQGIDLSDEKDRDEKGDLIVPKPEPQKAP